MKLNELLSADLLREAAGTRRVLERAPEGRPDWKPHPKSMALGYLTNLVATMPSWIVKMVNQDHWDLHPAVGEPYKQPSQTTRAEWLATHDSGVAQAQQALANATDEHLLTVWKFMVAGNVVSEGPRHVMIRDGVLSHLAHHCGQLTVYLRLNSEPVPALYGPSADEGQ
ncbi:MAG TPA: damage-inducible protein DinB [Terriglobales bacterium]|jgi:uncharacterized damage-inducible protein DinB|nr:damage-inducible protein DinB [Terriglobales bacterium]